MKLPSVDRRVWICLLLILLLGTAARVGLALGSEGRFTSDDYQGLHDIKAWVDAGTMVLEGRDPYVESYILDFGPVWAWICAVPVAIAGKLGIGPFGASVLIKTVLTLADISILALIAGIAIRSDRDPVIPSALFFLNPISVIITGYVGQFDALSMVPVAILALMLVRRQNEGGISTWKESSGAGLLMGVSAAVKHSSAPLLLFLPRMFTSRWKYLLSALTALLLFIVVFTPYLFDGGAGYVMDDLFGQQVRVIGTGWHWLFGLFGLEPSAMLQKVLWAALLLVTAILNWRNRADIRVTLALYYVTIVLFVPSFGRHYLLYPVIFGGLAFPMMTGLYTLVASAYLLSSSIFSGPLALTESPMPSWPVFLFLAVWWVYMIVRGRSGPSEQVKQ